MDVVTRARRLRYPGADSAWIATIYRDAERRYLTYLRRRLTRELRRIDNLGSLSAAGVFPGEEREFAQRLDTVLQRLEELTLIDELDRESARAERGVREAFEGGRVVLDKRSKRVERSPLVAVAVEAIGDEDLSDMGPHAEMGPVPLEPSQKGP